MMLLQPGATRREHIDDLVPEASRRAHGVLGTVLAAITVLGPPVALLLWPSTGRTLFYCGALALRALAIGFAARRRIRVGWRLVAAGCAVLSVAEAGRVLVVAYGRGAPALPAELITSVDVVRLIAYGALGLAVLSIVRRRGVRDRPAIIDASIVGCTLIAALWPVLAYPVAMDARTAVAPAPGWYPVALPLAAVALIACSVRLAIRRDRAYRLLALGLVTVAAGDIFRSELLVSSRDPGSREAVFLVALGFIALAVRRATGSSPEPRDVGAAERMRILCMLALVAPALIAPLGFAWMSGDRDTATLVSGLFAILMFGLVAWRLWHLAADARAAALRHGSRRVGALMQGLQDAIFVVDGSGLISYASPQAANLLGIDSGSIMLTKFEDCLGPENKAGIARQLHAVAGMETGNGEELVGQYTDAEANQRDFEMTLVNRLRDFDVAGIVVTLRDVTARRQLTRELERRAFRDDLTQLANRALFMDRLQQAHLRSRRRMTSVAVIFIDLDDFKAVNDGLGHAAGDALLRAVSDRLGQCTRSGDTIARLGGDEFAVLVEDVDNVDDVLQTAERLLEVLQLPVTIGEVSVAVPASIGVAVAEQGHRQSNLMRDADIALYRAKKLGKNRIALFDPAMGWEAHAHLHLRSQLQTALEQDQLRVLYQPIVSTDTGTIVGVEALVRWEHPTLGTLLPADFIPVAEESALINRVGSFVLRQACRDAVAFSVDQPDLFVSVNVSARQLREPAFARELTEVLESAAMEPHRLVIEMTESALVDEIAGENLERYIVPLGVRIAIDDFGTGYSSLAYLRRFSVDVVKIDRSFVAGLADEGMRAVVKSISVISAVMGYASIAEGIETLEEADEIRKLHYPFAQGFLYSQPVNAAEISEQLRRAAALVVG